MDALLTFNLQASDNTKFTPSFYIRGKALHRNTSKLFQLLHDMVVSADFSNVVRLKEVIHKHFSGLQSSLNQNALKYAINLSASGMDISSRIANTWYGLEYYWKIKNISENLENNAQELAVKLQNLQKYILGQENPDVVITCDAKTYDEIKGHGFYGLKNIEMNASKPWKSDYALTQVPDQGRIIPTPIAFTGKVFKTVPYTHPHAAALTIVACLCDNITLHAKIREQGGAYGGGATSNAMAGNFYFYSYRDPHIASTLDAFEESLQQILEGNFDDSDLEEAKLEMLQGMDSPIAPGSRGDMAYGWLREGKNFEVRSEFRKQLLNLTKEDVIDAVKEEILPRYNEGVVVTFAGRELLEKENAKLISRGKLPLAIERV